MQALNISGHKSFYFILVWRAVWFQESGGESNVSSQQPHTLSRADHEREKIRQLLSAVTSGVSLVDLGSVPTSLASQPPDERMLSILLIIWFALLLHSIWITCPVPSVDTISHGILAANGAALESFLMAQSFIMAQSFTSRFSSHYLHTLDSIPGLSPTVWVAHWANSVTSALVALSVECASWCWFCWLCVSGNCGRFVSCNWVNCCKPVKCC